jgi:transcriptional regulator with XRE-family HTH domain
MTFKELRESRGLSLQEFADEALVSLTLTRMMDRGYEPTKPITRRSVANVLGVGDAELTELFADR